MRLITPETNAHWYTANGEPRYDATLREARKENLLPSATSILKLWPKGALESWKQEQLILSALTLPRLGGESLDAFAHRIVADGQSQAKTTAQWGTRFHDCCEKLHGDPTMGEGVYAPPEMRDHYEFYKMWFRENVAEVFRCEHNVVNLEKGYAGKLDLMIQPKVQGAVHRIALGDIKSRSVKNRKAAYYDEQPMQLIAYGQALPEEERPDAYFSVIINRDKPEPPYVKWWEPLEMVDAWLNFLALLNLWKRVNRFDPARIPMEAEA